MKTSSSASTYNRELPIPIKSSINTNEYSEFRGLHIPKFNKDSASMNIPYTKFVLDHSELARIRVTDDLGAIKPQSNVNKHVRIRESKKVITHLPVVNRNRNIAADDFNERQVDRTDWKVVLKELDEFDNTRRQVTGRNANDDYEELLVDKRPKRKPRPIEE